MLNNDEILSISLKNDPELETQKLSLSDGPKVATQLQYFAEWPVQGWWEGALENVGKYLFIFVDPIKVTGFWFIFRCYASR